MSQQSGRLCPACGTPITPGQRFCTNCGADTSASGPVSQYGGNPQPPSYPQAQPPVPSYAQAPYGQYQQPQSPQKSSPIAEAFGALGLLFLLRRFRPGYRPRRQSSGCCGCLITLFILLIILGIPTYVAYKNNPHILQSLQQNASTGNAAGVPTTQPAITTASINQTVNYAGVDITIVNVQQSSAFLDDNATATNGMIRVNIKEANNSGQNASYFYSDMAHLILPDKSSVAITNVKQQGAPANSIVRTNWLDFAGPTSAKINQLTLLLGTSQEAQISIPLTGNANLSAYQAQTVHPNTPISYAGLNWTLKTATGSLSIGGKQAGTGMRYVVLTFNVDNPTSNNVVIGFANEYMRLKSGSTTNASTATTLPLYANANTTGVSGTVTFLMPSNGNSFTLEMLAIQSGIDPHNPVQVNTDFTL